ncbi:hypothetical protein Efla_004439 [Eimeria flavescens]
MGIEYLQPDAGRASIKDTRANREVVVPDVEPFRHTGQYQPEYRIAQAGTAEQTLNGGGGSDLCIPRLCERLVCFYKFENIRGYFFWSQRLSERLLCDVKPNIVSSIWLLCISKPRDNRTWVAVEQRSTLHRIHKRRSLCSFFRPSCSVVCASGCVLVFDVGEEYSSSVRMLDRIDFGVLWPDAGQASMKDTRANGKVVVPDVEPFRHTGQYQPEYRIAQAGTTEHKLSGGPRL